MAFELKLYEQRTWAETKEIFLNDYFSDRNSVVFFVYWKTFMKNSCRQKQMTLEFFKYSSKIPIGILVENADVFGFYFVPEEFEIKNT